MSKSRMTIKAIISWVMLGITLLAILAGIVFFAKFTNGFRSDFKDFYVVIESDTERPEIITTNKTLVVEIGKKYHVEPKYVIGLLGVDTELGYLVTANTNTTQETDFEFTVSGETVKYSEIPDMSKAIALSVHDDYFEFEITDDLPKLLQKQYETKDVKDVPRAVGSEYPYIVLRVYSDGNKECITLKLRLTGNVIDGVSLSSTQIVF